MRKDTPSIAEQLGKMEARGILCREDREVELLMLQAKSREERRKSLGRFMRKLLKRIEVDAERRGLPVDGDVTESFTAAANFFEGTDDEPKAKTGA